MASAERIEVSDIFPVDRKQIYFDTSRLCLPFITLTISLQLTNFGWILFTFGGEKSKGTSL